MPKKILLADDSVTIQKVVELTFSEGDYQVTCVSNGKMAVEQLNTNRPDIIICDIIMPELSGYDVAELVKRNPLYQAIPVILLTGTFEPFDEERARKSGAEAYVTKPFDSKMLVDKVESLLAQKVQFQAVQTIPPATVVQGGREYELPGVVSDEAVKQMDAHIHQKPGLESYDFPDSPVIEGELPAVAPPPPEESSFESPVVEDLSMPAEKGEPEELRGFDAIMEPPEPQDIVPPSALEVTASSVPPGAEAFRTEIPPEMPAWQEPELPETALSQEAVQPPEVAVEPRPEGPKEEPYPAETAGIEISEPKIEESMIPDLPEVGAAETDISIGEPSEEAPAGALAPAEGADKFFEPPVFEAPPAMQMEEAEVRAEEAPKAFMEIPPVPQESQQIVPPDTSVLVTDMNEQAMMVAEGQKKIDEEKVSMPREEELVEEAREYPIQQPMEEPAEVAEEEEPAPPAEEDLQEPSPAEPQPPQADVSPAEITVSPEVLEEIVRKVVAELAPGIVTSIAWEVIPELANSIIKKRIEELEKEAE